LTPWPTTLAAATRVGIDTSPFIYLIEAHPHYLSLVAPLFAHIDAGEISAVTSTITLAEVTVLPLRLQRNDLRQQYVNFLLNSRNLDLVAIDIHVAQAAAELRAQYGVRLPDALQLAAARAAGCDCFVTNDRTLKQVTDLRVIVLADLLDLTQTQ